MEHKITRALWLLMVITMVAMLAACGGTTPTKSEEEMIADLGNRAFEQIYEPDLTIRELKIIKRQTIEEERKDTVYVTVTIDGKSARYVRSYILYYSLYDEGWILDSVEGYMDGENTAYPLTGPDESYIDNFFNTFTMDDTEDNDYTSWEITDSSVDLEAKTAQIYVQATREYPIVTMNEQFVFECVFYDRWEIVTSIDSARTSVALEWSNLENWRSLEGAYYGASFDTIDIDFSDYDSETGEIYFSGLYHRYWSDDINYFGETYYLPTYMEESYSESDFIEYVDTYELATIDLGDGFGIELTATRILFCNDRNEEQLVVWW